MKSQEPVANLDFFPESVKPSAKPPLSGLLGAIVSLAG